jgi:hypothetical protein
MNKREWPHHRIRMRKWVAEEEKRKVGTADHATFFWEPCCAPDAHPRRDHQPTAQITQPPKQNFGKFSKGSENSENLWND